MPYYTLPSVGPSLRLPHRQECAGEGTEATLEVSQENQGCEGQQGEVPKTASPLEASSVSLSGGVLPSTSALHYQLYKGTTYEQYCDRSEWEMLDAAQECFQ